jgi:hypothetical protein
MTNHQLLQRSIERGASIRRQGAEIGGFGRVLGKKLLFDFDQEAEGNSATERFLCDGEEGEATCGRSAGVFRGRAGDVVDVV